MTGRLGEIKGDTYSWYGDRHRWWEICIHLFFMYVFDYNFLAASTSLSLSLRALCPVACFPLAAALCFELTTQKINVLRLVRIQRVGLKLW